MRRFACLLLGSLVLLAMVSGPALAHSDTGKGRKPVPSSPVRSAPADPADRPEFREHIQGPLHTGPGDPRHVSPSHWSWWAHTHTFLNIYNRYDGYDPDERLAGPMSCPAGGTRSCTLGYNQTRSWSHKFGVNIGFDVAQIRAGVGYDVTYQSSEQIIHSVTFEPGFTAEIWRNQWYHVQEYNVRNTYFYHCGYTLCIHTENGIGWAAQWFKNQIDPRVWRS